MSNSDKRFAFFLLILTSLLTAMFVIGCGGSGNNPQSTSGFTFTKTPIQAQLQIPAGSTISASSLTPWSSGGATKFDASGQSNVTIYNNGPQYADVRNSEGKLVFISYLSNTQTVFNAETTATAMIFFAIGGASQIDEGPSTVLNGIKDFSGFNAVVNEILNQIVSQGHVSLATGTLAAKIQAVVDSVRGTTPPAGRGTIAEPTSASGIFLDTIIDGKFTIQNNYLRRASGWLRRVEYVDSEGIKHEGPEAQTEYKKFEIKPPSRYGGFTGTAANILKGEFLWTPTVSEPYAIPLYPETAQSTTYELKVYGFGGNDGNVVSLTADDIDEVLELSFKSLILDAALPIIANIIIPLKGGAIEDFLKFAGSSSALSDLINISRETAPQLADQLSQGQVEDALTTLYETLLTSNTFLPAMLEIVIEYAESRNLDLNTFNTGTLAKDVGEKLALLGVVDIFFSSADMILYVSDIARSGRCHRFLITTTPGKVSITAEYRSVSVTNSSDLTAVIQNKNPDAVYKYEWSVEEGYEITADNGTTSNAPGGILTTSQETVEIKSLTEEPGFATVNCKVTRIDGPNDVFVATAKYDFKFVPDVIVTPESVQLGEEEQVTINAEYEGEEELRFMFQCDRSDLGIWTNGNVVEDKSSSTFTANGQPGLVTVTVYMFFVENGNPRPISSKTVRIQCGTITGTRVYPHTINSTGIDQNDDFWGKAQTHLFIPKSLGSGTFVIYRNGTPFRTFDSGNPSYSQHFQSIFWPTSQFNHVVEFETRWQDGFLTNNEAESWGRQQGTILFDLYMAFPNNIYTVQLQPN
jgi:hypothetical protein